MIRVCPECDRKYPEDIDFCAQDGTRLREMDDDQADPLVGRVLDGRWVIEKRIGVGGMGAVYLGSQRSVDRKVAIKTLKPELSSSREFVERFFREARVASKISHPNSVTILDFGQADDDTLYLAMEYLEGMPLTDRLRQGNLAVREIVEICIQISSALAAAHVNQIIHRDLKPDNIYLLSISDDSTFIKVLDFGIAKVIDAEEKMTQTGQVFGTPEYMSPEQCRGDAVDGRSDLYSLGCILYRMLVGRPPFESDTPMAVLVSHVSEPPQNVRELIERNDIPDALADLCMRMLAKNAQDRPENAQAVRAELEQILANTTTSANAAVPPATGPTEAVAPLVTDDAAMQAADGDAGMAENSASAQPREAKPAAVAQPPGGMTTAPPAAQPPKQKSSLPIILGVLVVLVLSSGCILGGFLFWDASSKDGTSDGFLAGLFGEEASAIIDNDSPESDNVEDEALAEAEAPSPEEDSPPAAHPDETGTDQALEADEDESNQPAHPPSGLDSNILADNRATDPPTGTATSNKSRTADNNTASAQTNPDKPTKHVEPHADKPAKAKSPATTKTPKKKRPGSSKPPADPSPTKPARGNIRQTKLSVVGAACIEPDIESVLKGARGKLLSCYQDVLSTNPDASGQVMLSWNITPEGSSLRPEVSLSEVKKINSCLLSTLKRLRFEPAVDGRCFVRATYHFSP